MQIVDIQSQLGEPHQTFFMTDCRHANAIAHEAVDHLESFSLSREISQSGIE